MCIRVGMLMRKSVPAAVITKVNSSAKTTIGK